MRACGTMLGTCCATVMAEGTDPVLAMKNLMHFYHHESCGQCTPCREGSAWLDRVVGKILDGQATMAELDQLHDIANNIMGNTICAFGEGTAMPALGFLRKFRKEFEAYVRGDKKRSQARLTVDGSALGGS
jgi:NADH-quinone oxidoreductase subunit F